MRLGIFAKTFQRPTIEATLDAVVSHGLRCIQFNYASAGLPSMPNQLDAALVERIAKAIKQRSVEVAAVSGTFNIIHPDAARRDAGFKSLEVIAANCAALGSKVITLCTGTFDPDDMWRDHPENNSPAAWKQMLAGIERALAIAEVQDVVLGIEPEMANVINSAEKARRLLDTMRTPRLKIVMDAANLLSPANFAQAPAVFTNAFDLLGPDIVIAHAKDIRGFGEFAAAGQGAVDWALYLKLLARASFFGPLILHGLAESEVAGSVALLQRKLKTLRSS
jgi:sugar phosphate isomerase/epimerase